MAEKGEAIRRQSSRLREEQEVVREEGTSAAAFVNIALAERLGALRTARFVAERAARADLPAVIELPRRLGAGDPPLSGDEIDAPQGEAHLVLANRSGEDRKAELAVTTLTAQPVATAASGVGNERPS